PPTLEDLGERDGTVFSDERVLGQCDHRQSSALGGDGVEFPRGGLLADAQRVELRTPGLMVGNGGKRGAHVSSSIECGHCTHQCRGAPDSRHLQALRSRCSAGLRRFRGVRRRMPLWSGLSRKYWPCSRRIRQVLLCTLRWQNLQRSTPSSMSVRPLWASQWSMWWASVQEGG